MITKILDLPGLQDPQGLLHQFYTKKSTCMENYDSIQKLSVERKENGVIYSSYLYHYKQGNLIWLKYLMNQSFFEQVLCFINNSEINLAEHRIDFSLHDEDQDIYLICGSIDLEPSSKGYVCYIEIDRFDIYLASWLPNWVKDRISKHIIYRIEKDLLFFYHEIMTLDS